MPFAIRLLFHLFNSQAMSRTVPQPYGIPLLTSNEQRVIDLLATAYDRFKELSPVHSDELAEFRAAIHTAQTIVQARPVMRPN
jgi:hypothetical protein